MKNLKTFEGMNIPEKTKEEIEYWFITYFTSEEDFNEWCMEKDGVDDVEYVSFDNIIGYSIPMELDLPTYSDYDEVIGDIISEIDLDDPNYADLRSGKIGFGEWKESIKYNL